MLPMITKARDMRPPAPTPCTARNAASWYIVSAMPHRTEPTTKMPIANR